MIGVYLVLFSKYEVRKALFNVGDFKIICFRLFVQICVNDSDVGKQWSQVKMH